MTKEDIEMAIYIDSAGQEIDTVGLPDELIAELKCKTDELEDQIIYVIPKDGSGISLDAILVALYRRFGVLKSRRFLQNKIYRMQQVDTAAGRAGIYTVHPALIESEDR